TVPLPQVPTGPNAPQPGGLWNRMSPQDVPGIVAEEPPIQTLGSSPFEDAEALRNALPMPQPETVNYGQGRVMDILPQSMPENNVQMPEQPVPAPSVGVAPWKRLRPTTTAEWDERIREAQNYEQPREKSFVKRLGKGLMDGWINWAQNGGQGGLGGLIGSVATGGIIDAASPGAHAEYRKQQELQKMWGGRAQTSAAEKERRDAAYRDMQIRKPEDDARRRLEMEDIRQQNRLEVIKAGADIKSGEAKIFVDQEGKVWKQFLKPDANGNLREMEPVMNPNTRTQEIAVGEQMVPWPDPYTGQTVQVKAKQIINAGATIAAGNANRQQQADTTNARAEMDAQEANARNILSFNSQVLDLAKAAAAADAEETKALGEVQGIANEMDRLNKLLAEFKTPDSFGNTREWDYEGQNKILTKYAELDNKYQQAVAKSKAMRDAVEQLRAKGVVRPATVTPVRIRAAQVTNGQRPPIGEARKQAQARYPQATPEQIEQILKTAGY
ncbi:MAG TPA: hypothetical protein PKO33_00205, partial [Pyrinomonadaceae bacterium]|nr:hypothetical protein [Pyrinomonadaceae bacterium]